MKRLIIPCLAALALSACATAPTQFQPAARPGGVGFSEMRIEPGRYRVTFQGGPGALPAQVEDYALLRAADLAIAEGYDWFRVIDRETRQNGYTGATLGVGIGGMSFGRAPGLTALLVFAGAVTTAPLLLFAVAARELRMATLGLLQFLAPSLQFLLAVTLFGETLDATRLISFALIWAGLACYVASSLLGRTA